jgi:hypothetical protein
MTQDNFYTGYTTQHLTSLFDELTGEVNLRNNKLPIEKDIFLPPPNYDRPVEIDTLFGSNISDVDNLKYFFDAFLKTVERDKSDARAARNLKNIIDSIIINDSMVFRHNILENKFKKKFVIPVGKIDEKETKSFITKLKEKIFKK